MTIIKRKHASHFVMLPNELFGRQDLSLAAKGLLGYLLSLPSDWEVRLSQLRHRLKIGRKALDRCFKELIDTGYVVRSDKQKRDANNRFAPYEYTIQDKPDFSAVPGAPVPVPETPQRKRRSENNKDNNKTLLQTPLPPNAGVRGATKGPPRKADVFVVNGSPQREAWDAFDRQNGRKRRPACGHLRTQHDVKEGWYFESEWPPDVSVPQT